MVSRNKTQPKVTRSGPLAFALTTIIYVALGNAYEYAWPNWAQPAENTFSPGSVIFTPQQGNAQGLPTPYQYWTGDFITTAAN